ncbi:MAG: hypothetical protein ACWGMZ_04630, partial [Thermoguttaceae bacterium]
MSSVLDPYELANIVEIDWFDENDNIVVTPRNQERFSIQKDRAIEALRLAKHAERFALQFDLLLKNLGKWIKDRATAIADAIVTWQDNSLMLVIVQREVHY